MSHERRCENLSRGLRTMKFMKRRSQPLSSEAFKQEQQEQKIVTEQKTRTLALRTEEFWSLDLNYLTKKINPEQIVEVAPKYSIRDCYEMGNARQSYGGFNPEIEKSTNDEEPETVGHEDMDADVSDETMMRYIKDKQRRKRKSEVDSGGGEDEEDLNELNDVPARKRFKKPDTGDLLIKQEC